MNRRLPTLAWVLGLAGLLPFIGCGLGSVSGTEPQANELLGALVAYGAVILAFLGGVHWGFAIVDDPVRADRPRLLLGVLPSLAGWVALLLPLIVPREAGLAVLIVGFIVLVGVEAQGRRLGLVPPGYMALRWVLSVIVVAILTTVLVLRLAGAHIIY